MNRDFEKWWEKNPMGTAMKKAARRAFEGGQESQMKIIWLLAIALAIQSIAFYWK